MKKGFALLETIVVVTFLGVAMLMLYSPFSNMINNSKKNILYDDVANIYKVYYLKEYLMLNNLGSLVEDGTLKEISCNNFSFTSCNSLLANLGINKIYLASYNLVSYNKDNYTSIFNNYVDSFTKSAQYKYRLIVEFKNDKTYSYASIGIGDNENE